MIETRADRLVGRPAVSSEPGKAIVQGGCFYFYGCRKIRALNQLRKGAKRGKV